MNQPIAGRNFVEMYLDFCANPLRGATRVCTELGVLASNPDVAMLKFYSPGVLMVGTKPLIITHEAVRYEIGELVIFLVRHRVGRIWETDFRFLNVTRTVTSEVYDGDQCVHPHIRLSKNGGTHIKEPVGQLCISQGQFGVYQFLRKGEIHYAVPRILEILRTYGEGHPYAKVSCWPKLEENVR